MKDAGIFLGSQRKLEGFFGLQRKSSDFFG